MPVLLVESINYLITDKNGTYIDGTLGGGGHATRIMQNLNSGGNLFAFDKDIAAIIRCKSLFDELNDTKLGDNNYKKYAEYLNSGGNQDKTVANQPGGAPGIAAAGEISIVCNSLSPSFVSFNTSFSDAASICKERNISPAGILLDLGVSSQQLDTDQRGISYRVNSPLDMRFGSSGISAKDILNSYTEEELTDIFYKYGEEPRSKKIAQHIVTSRRINSIYTTFELRKIIEEITPKILHFKTLSRIFQALRIEVNKEISELTKTLNEIIEVLSVGGRIVVISYHSLEDRVVKQIFKENSQKNKQNKYANCDANCMPKLKILTQKPIIPAENEILRNPRARSAKMRVAEKIK